MSINQRRLIEPAKFGQEMSKYRHTVGLSAQSLSKTLGYDRITLYRWELGKFSPSLVAAKAWADSLGLELTIGLRPRRPKTSSPSLFLNDSEVRLVSASRQTECEG